MARHFLFRRSFVTQHPWLFYVLYFATWLLVGMLVGLLLTGCTSTPFTSEGVSQALEAAAPIVRELTAGTGEGRATHASCQPRAPVTVVIIFPNMVRSIWPFSEVRLGVTSERYVIVVPQPGATDK